MTHEIDIAEYLRSLSGDLLYYRPNPGNAGDSLIAHATFQMLAKLGLAYKVVRDSGFDARGKTVVYAGGGNLVPYYHDARRFLERCHCHAKRLIILPHTIWGNEDLLSAFGERVDIICRERVSYSHVVRYAHKANVMLTHDLAFSLDIRAAIDTVRPSSYLCFLLMFPGGRYEVPSPRGLIKRLRSLGAALCMRERGGALSCFRTDAEKTSVTIRRDNLDLSSLMGVGTRVVADERVAHRVSCRLLALMSKFQEIRTNRLHLAIAGALLGKEVKFFENSYYKCEAVYEYSMKDRFPLVQWMGHQSFDE